MARFRFSVPSLGTVTLHEDNETCARERLGEHLGRDPDGIELIDAAGDEAEGPGVVVLTPLEALLSALAVCAATAAVLLLRRR